MMEICVVGLWHLGIVTAACMAKIGHHVTAYDANNELIQTLQSGETPLFEPGLKDMLQAGIAAGNLTFSAATAAVAQAELIWVTYDTPVDENDVADVDFVIRRVTDLLPFQDAINEGIEAILTGHILFPALDAENVDISPTDFPRLIKFAQQNDVQLTVVGPGYGNAAAYRMRATAIRSHRPQRAPMVGRTDRRSVDQEDDPRRLSLGGETGRSRCDRGGWRPRDRRRRE